MTKDGMGLNPTVLSPRQKNGRVVSCRSYSVVGRDKVEHLYSDVPAVGATTRLLRKREEERTGGIRTRNPCDTVVTIAMWGQVQWQ